MVNYICSKCNKNFNKKSNFNMHTLNKKKPCNIINLDKTFIEPQIETLIEPLIEPQILKSITDENPLVNENHLTDNNFVCPYCNKIFTRNDNLQRHLNIRCKNKKNFDEIEKLKTDMKILFDNYNKIKNENNKIKNDNNKIKNDNVNLKKLIETDNFNLKKIIENNNVNFKKEIEKIKNVSENKKTINNNQKINNGLIINNSNINVVQFGEEDIDKIDIIEAMKTFLSSTGGNIISNMICYLNLNSKYPQNNNICITDNSREIVKMHNGKKFIYKKFKNAKEDILKKTLKNTHKIVVKYEEDKNIKKSEDKKKKKKINKK